MDLINKKMINLNLQQTTKVEALKEMIQMLESEKRITDSEKFLADIIKREEEVTTGFGEGLAIPHAQSDYVLEPSLLFAKSKAGIEYDSLDGEKVNTLFMIAIPKAKQGEHLKLLQMLSRKFMDDEFKVALNQVQTNDEAYELINGIFTESKEEQVQAQTSSEGKLNIVAIANCPAGIAHTYMVAESLEQKAQELGIKIKVETQGASGVENKLSSSDIAAADYVILALGKGLSGNEKNRFAGKKVYNIKISEALKKIDVIFDDLETKSVKYASDNNSNDEEEVEEKDTIMSHLMAGV